MPDSKDSLVWPCVCQTERTDWLGRQGHHDSMQTKSSWSGPMHVRQQGLPGPALCMSDCNGTLVWLYDGQRAKSGSMLMAKLSCNCHHPHMVRTEWMDHQMLQQQMGGYFFLPTIGFGDPSGVVKQWLAMFKQFTTYVVACKPSWIKTASWNQGAYLIKLFIKVMHFHPDSA